MFNKLLRARAHRLPKQWTAFEGRGPRRRLRVLASAFFIGAGSFATSSMPSIPTAGSGSGETTLVAGPQVDMDVRRSRATEAEAWRTAGFTVRLMTVADHSRTGSSEIENLLASVGVDLDRLLARVGAVPPGQGGPFVALDGFKVRPKGSGGNDDLVAGLRAENLQRVLRSLPLTAPLNQFQIESGFGARSDPFNRRRSVHTGLDFSAPFRSPVYSTGPGTVIFAGPKGDYGKVVEIDHGSGIVTRYAHLHRTMVVPGQRLTAREQIGQLGSTGRSSGPHVHYEVLVEGVPQDPEKFLAIGRTVLPATSR